MVLVSRIRADFLGRLEKCCTAYKLDVNQKNSQKGNRNIIRERKSSRWCYLKLALALNNDDSDGAI